MNKLSYTLLLAAASVATSFAQQPLPDIEVKTGQFTPSWVNLSQWECPEWFKDAKFGIWAHWGPQCYVEACDWYARSMYYPETWQYKHHLEYYGNPAEYGLKEICRDWKAENWDPAYLVARYKSVGARYFFTLGQHHDNFDLWDSPYQPWNSVNMGPKRDIVAEWAQECKKNDLPLGISMHGSHTWTWFEGSQAFDGNLTKEDGAGQWWEGYDPQDLYAQNHEPSQGWENVGRIHNQWDWQNGASHPSKAFMQKLQNRVLQCINDYHPDMIYFDDTVLPFYGYDDSYGLNILAHYYNTNPNVVAMGKILEPMHKKAMLWDVERGVPDNIQQEYWQTCTCIGDWHYNKGIYNQNRYKSAQQVIDMLIDVVSKNGNLLLSIPVKSDGTIDELEEAVLDGIKAWMDQNSVSIYGTRPWKTFGEGPMAEAGKALKAQGFNESNEYSNRDVRYVIKHADNADEKDTLYATILRWPEQDSFTFRMLGRESEHYSGEVEKCELLGYGTVDHMLSADGLTVNLPARTNDIAPVIAITFAEQ